MKILIKVTKDVLKATMMCGVGDKRVASNCAISYAAREIFNKCSVTYDDKCQPAIYIYPSNNIYGVKIPLPSQAGDFMFAFDSLESSPESRLALTEQSFEVDVPEAAIQIIGISEAYRILSESKTLELVMPK
jgi:hypothetical protein